MDSIFVTGSLGFIGKKIIQKLSKSEVLTDSNNSKRIDLRNIKEVLEIDSADVVLQDLRKVSL